jgi:hypothetical protein
LSDLAWYPRIVLFALNDPFGLQDPRAAAIALGVGAIALLVRAPRILLALAAPTVFLAAASSVGLYPVNGRLLLFLGPLVAMLVGLGVATVARVARQYRGLAVAILAVVVILLPAWGPSTIQIRYPRFRREAQTVLQVARSRWQEGDIVFAADGYGRAMIYYSNRLGIPRQARLDRPDGSGSLAFLPTSGRLWVVANSDNKTIESEMNALGHQESSFGAYQMTLFLYTMGAS